MILGIDPGVKGAFALLDTRDNRVTCMDMPDTTAALVELILSLPPLDFCAIEKPFYPQMIGIKNAAKIAEAYGAIKASLVWRGIPAHETRPAEWKAALGLSSSKSASREKAGMIFPDDAEQWKLIKHDGRAEAALIAWYGKRWAA